MLLVIAGCTQAAPAATPTKAAEPTKAPAEPTKPAPAATTAPEKKVVYPEKGKTITLLIPFAAGGATDIQGRVMASFLEKELGTQVVVVNRVGASGQVGTTELVQAKPDGYTFA
ncbi:MAG: tripartite tricarboxylate transporter substrate-binding protein, partial [Dehalococcoidales bacterium]|nr:tripartite tricarboxylate transporter substrate-binding protein [Dehalococcoidales bacterium]